MKALLGFILTFDLQSSVMLEPHKKINHEDSNRVDKRR